METEHHEHHQNPKKENIIAASIIAGAVLVSVSIFYNTKLLIQEFSIGSTAGGSKATQAPTAPSAQGSVAEPAAVAERKGAPVLGKKSAKVAVMEFSDFQCPFCQRFFNDAFKEIKSKYVDTGKVQFVFRHFPLSFHANAEKAAVAAECAHRQGKFWEYHDVLFTKMQADGTGLDAASLKQYARDLKLNSAKFDQCFDNNETLEIVKKDMADGTAAGVSGTPTVFVNGVKIVGAQPSANFEKVIEEALK